MWKAPWDRKKNLQTPRSGVMAWFEPEPSSWCAQRAFTASAPRPHEHNSLPDPADLHIDLFISHPPYIGEVETHVQP